VAIYSHKTTYSSFCPQHIKTLHFSSITAQDPKERLIYLGKTAYTSIARTMVLWKLAIVLPISFFPTVPRWEAAIAVAIDEFSGSWRQLFKLQRGAIISQVATCPQGQHFLSKHLHNGLSPESPITQKLRHVHNNG
jgi:hypothetical protein